MLFEILLVAGAVMAPSSAPSTSPAIAKQAAAKQPAAKQPAAKQLAVQRPTATRPAAKKPVAKAKKPTKARFALHRIEQEVIAKTNAERARRGLRPLKTDVYLVRSARQHTAWMTNRGSLTHTSQPVAENIAMGQTSSSEAVRSWMNSPGHRANMLNPGYSRVGAAAYRTRGGAIYWCMQFLR
jgi:uncharacterized protein YkwD